MPASIAYVAFLAAALDAGAAASPSRLRAAPDSSADLTLHEILVEAPRPWGSGFPFPRTRLDAARHANTPAKDLADLLASSPGVHVRRRGGPGSPSIASLRGTPPEGVLVLLDGERLNGAQGAVVDLSQVPLVGITSVEVLRGGGSLFYGGGALGGVVNIITTPNEMQSSSDVAFEVGSLESMAGSASVTRTFPGGWVRALARSFRTEGSFPYPDDGVAEKSVRLNADGTSRLLDAGAEARTRVGSLRLSLRTSRTEGGSPGLVDFPTPRARREDSRHAAQARLLHHASEISLGLSRDQRAYTDSEDPLGPVEARHRATAVGLRGTGRARHGDVAIEGGFEGRYETLESTTDGEPTRRTVAAFGAVTLSRLVGCSWIAGLRWDATSAFRPEPTARIGVTWESGPVRTRVAGGTSFRPPTFDDLFWPASGMAVGNPELHPERAIDGNVGVDLGSLGAAPRVSLDVFRQDVHDLIFWNPGPSGIWRPSNVGRAVVRGVEASVDWNEVERWGLPRVEANATLLSAVDRSGRPNTDGRDLPGRARRLAAWRIEKSLGPRFRLQTAWRAVGDVPRTAANTKSIPGYVVGSVSARVVALPWLIAHAEIENVSDVTYEDFHDLPIPGRLYRVAIQWRHGDGPARSGKP